MLFDLQTRGRRRVVKVIYTGLAVLMGGGLLLFGIGTGTGGGGFLDVFKGGGTSTKTQISAAEKRASREVRVNPRSTQAWADLTRAEYQNAGVDQTQNGIVFTEAGRVQLAKAVRSWQRYLALNPKKPDSALARLMAQAYGPAGLNQLSNATAALEIVTQQDPSAASYGELAQFSYSANELRKGDLAAAKAVELAPKAQRQIVKQNLAAARKQIVRQQLQQAAQQAVQQQGGTTTPKAPAAKAPKR
jgi:hypothetical protein